MYSVHKPSTRNRNAAGFSQAQRSLLDHLQFAVLLPSTICLETEQYRRYAPRAQQKQCHHATPTYLPRLDPNDRRAERSLSYRKDAAPVLRRVRSHVFLLPLLPADDVNPIPLPPCQLQLPEVVMDDLAILLLVLLVEAAKVGIIAATAVCASCTRVARVFGPVATDTPLAALSTRRRNRPSMALTPAAGKHIFSGKVRASRTCTASCCWQTGRSREGSAPCSWQVGQGALRKLVTRIPSGESTYVCLPGVSYPRPLCPRHFDLVRPSTSVPTPADYFFCYAHTSHVRDCGEADQVSCALGQILGDAGRLWDTWCFCC